ncbi:RNA-binding protein, putative [Babesia caballi]|uniref:RNA-binding protein, putative n=1 Tax=Babesia caballi TaxID=5871 RepID=A0AAV4LX48_BABCB|nr:RNA-binding protein, putative [Babesia caballi]
MMRLYARMLRSCVNISSYSKRGFTDMNGLRKSCGSYCDIGFHLANLETHHLKGETRAQITCLSALCDLKVGMLDDRVRCALDNIKQTYKTTCVGSQSLLHFVTCLHKFGDVDGLLDVMRHFSKEIVFMQLSDVVRLARILSMRCDGSMEFQELRRSVQEYLRARINEFTLDDRLSCVLSCVDILENPGLVRFTLLSYVENVGQLEAGDWRTLKTVLCALRLHRKFKVLQAEIIHELVERSFDKVVDCLETLEPQTNLDYGELIARTCYLLTILCREDKAARDAKLVYNLLWRVCGSDVLAVFSVKSIIHILRSMHFCGDRDSDTRKKFESLIVLEAPKMSTADMLSCLGCVNIEAASVISSQLLTSLNELKPKAVVKLLKFYASCAAPIPPAHADQLKEHFCVNCERMAPIEFATCFNYLVVTRLFDRSILAKAVRYIHNHSANLSPAHVGLFFHAFGKARLYPSRNIVQILHDKLESDIDKFTFEDLVRCYVFISTCWKRHDNVVTTLREAIDDRLNSDVPTYHLCSLARSTIRYRNRRFQTSLYSAIFSRIKEMNLRQLCLTFKAFAQSGLRNRDMNAKLSYYIGSHGSSLDTQDIHNIVTAMQLGYSTDALRAHLVNSGKMNDLQRFLIIGDDIDFEKLQESELLSCLFAIHRKSMNERNARVIKQLCLKICKLPSFITPQVSQVVADLLREHGHTKPKLIKALRSRNRHVGYSYKRDINEDGSRQVTASRVHLDYASFRPICLGPPHLNTT